METINIKNVSVDVRKSQSTTIEFFQNDTNIIKFTVTDNGAIPDLETVDEILVNYARPDGEIFTRLLTAESNVITYQLGYSEMAVAGSGKISLQFYKGSDRISTFNVNVSVRKSLEATFTRSEVNDGLVDQVFTKINAMSERIENIVIEGGGVPLSSSLTSISENTAATSRAVKELNDRISSKVEKAYVDNLIGQIQEGSDGEDGKSAYQIWLDIGNVGTEQDFINSLRAVNNDLLTRIEALERALNDGTIPSPPTDTTPPTLTITAPTSFTSTQTVTMSVNESADIYYTLNGATPTAENTKYTGPITLTDTTTVKAFARDTAGNNSAIQTVTFTKTAAPDTTPPANVTNLSASNVSTNSVNLMWTASTSGDVAGYDIYNGNSLVTSITGTTYTVTGLSPNTPYTFTVKAKDGSGNAAVGVSLDVKTANASVLVTGVSLDRTVTTLEEGKTVRLSATVLPVNATNKAVEWYSSDVTIATVSNVGVVTALKTGSVIITAKTVDGNFTADCSVAITQTIVGFDYNNLVAYGTDTHVNFDQTVNGQSDFVHPSVLYFEQGWNGHKYWMGVNPYPDTQGVEENPFLFYSDDGDNWVTPNGLTQPIYPKEADVNNNSDSHIFMDYDGVTMHYLNRGAFENNGSMTEIFSTTDGVTFTPRRRILSSKNSPADPDYVSPSVCLVDGKYYMFATDVTDMNVLCVLEATDVYGKWTEINRISTGTLGQMWHCEVRYLNQEFIVLGSTNYISGGNLMLGKFTSVNDEVIVGRNNAFMKPLGTSPWNFAIYKSSLVYKSNEDIEIFIGNKGNRLDATTDWRVARVSALRLEQTLNLTDHTLTSNHGTLTTTKGVVDYNKYAIEGTVASFNGAIVAFADSTNQHANLRISESILVAQLWNADGGTLEKNIHYGISIGDKVTIVKDVHVDFYINGRLVHRFENGGAKLHRNGTEFFSLNGTNNYIDVKIYKKNTHFYSATNAATYKQSLVTEYTSNPGIFIMYDEFNRANGAVGISTNNKTWEIIGEPTIESNALKPNGRDTNAALISVSGNYQILFDVSKTGSNPMYGVYLKYTDSNNYIKYTLEDGQGRARFIDIKENGVVTRTEFTTYGDSYLNHKIIRLEVINNVLYAYEDNLLIAVRPIPDKPFNNKVGFTSVYNATSYDYIIIKELQT